MRRSLWYGALAGALASLAAMGLLYLAAALFGWPFLPFALFEGLAGALPGGLVSAGIDAVAGLVTALGVGPTDAAAKLVEQALALGLFVLLCAALGALAGALGGRRAADTNAARRRLLRLGWASALLGASAWALGWALRRPAAAVGSGRPLAAPPPTPIPPAARTGTRPAPGTRPELTANESFYRIDINLRPPAVDGQSWRLVADGLLDRPRSLSLADLRAYPAVTQPITISCISNQIGGDLIGASQWTGLRLRDLARDLGLRPEASALAVEAADGFYETVTMEDLLDPRTLLVYAMNGDTLPVAHGYPLRVYIPNRYGMKQPKWITHIEAVAEPRPGYWVERGWSRQARPHIVTIIDAVGAGDSAAGPVPVGGIAWAGDRGISSVEVQVDDGPWQAATLLDPPLGPLTWVLWRYDWPRRPGRHTFRARATDGAGNLQVGAPGPPHPDGATGYHEVSKSI